MDHLESEKPITCEWCCVINMLDVAWIPAFVIWLCLYPELTANAIKVAISINVYKIIIQ